MDEFWVDKTCLDTLLSEKSKKCNVWDKSIMSNQLLMNSLSINRKISMVIELLGVFTVYKNFLGDFLSDD